MINIWNLVLERILVRLAAEDIRVSYSTEDNPKPASFPHVSLVESDDYTYTRTITRQGETHAVKLYSVNVYSNSEAGRKAEAEKIMGVIDDEMLSMGFVRRSMLPASNLNQATVYRIAARYSGVVSKSGMIYRA